jgi:hypothetical protein
VTGPIVLSLDRARYHTVLAALCHLGTTDLGHTLGLDTETVREARTAFPDGPPMMRPPAIERYLHHLRRALDHQDRQGFAEHVLILDPAQYKTLWIALWLYERAGLTESSRRPPVIAALADGTARGLQPGRGLTGHEARAFITTVGELGRHAAWT